jgi:hypothetical protein
MTAGAIWGNLIGLTFNNMDLKHLHKEYTFKEVQHASALKVKRGSPYSPYIFW